MSSLLYKYVIPGETQEVRNQHQSTVYDTDIRKIFHEKSLYQSFNDHALPTLNTKYVY